jgi:hypothetical protein
MLTIRSVLVVSSLEFSLFSWIYRPMEILIMQQILGELWSLIGETPIENIFPSENRLMGNGH